MVFADAEHIKAHFVSKRDCFEQLAEMSCGVDGPAGRVNGCGNETVYSDLHLLMILVQAAMRCCQRPENAERTLRNTTIHSTVTTSAKGRPLGSINM